MIKWEGPIIVNKTLTYTEYPDGGGIPLEMWIPVYLVVIIIMIVYGGYRCIKKILESDSREPIFPME